MKFWQGFTFPFVGVVQSLTSEPDLVHPFLQLLTVRVREFIREPSAIFWVYAFPLIMVVALGTAFRTRPVEEIIVDVQSGTAANAISTALKSDKRFRVTVSPQHEADRRLQTGRTELVIRSGSIIGQPSEARPLLYEYRYDPTRPGSVLARNTVDDVLQRSAGREDVVETRNDEISLPGSRYIDFLVPGLIGMGLMGGGMWGVGFATVDLRIRKLLKRFLATPMKRPHFLGAMMLSRLLFTVPEVIVILLFSRFLFGVQVQGNWLVTGLLILAGAFQFSGIGLLVASRATTLETVSGLMNFVMIPMWIGSGIFFSPDRFPEYAQPAIRCLPLTPLISTLRDVMLEGAGISDIAGRFVVILIWGLVTVLLAVKLFRWQ